MDRSTVNMIKVVIGILVLVAVFLLFIVILAPLFYEQNPLIFIGVVILFVLILLVVIPYIMFTYRGKE